MKPEINRQQADWLNQAEELNDTEAAELNGGLSWLFSVGGRDEEPEAPEAPEEVEEYYNPSGATAKGTVIPARSTGSDFFTSIFGF